MKQIDYRDLFLTDESLLDHIEGYGVDNERYIATFMLLQTSDVHLSWEVKEKVLGTLLVFKNEAAIEFLFTKPFWTIIDIRNVIRLLWTKSKDSKELRKIMRDGRSIRKPRRDMLKDRVSEMDPDQIERSILRHSYDAWREVIDYLHIAEKDFPDYFHHELDDQAYSPLLKTIMDGTWEPTPWIKTMRSINNKNAISILMRHPAEFHYLRSKLNFEKHPEIARAYLQMCDPKNIIRWYQELWWPSTQEIISKRLRSIPLEQPIHHPYSRYFNLLYENKNVMDNELYESLLFRADDMTGRFILPVATPALIAVDQSSSMSEEQVKIGTVIASQCGAQLDADLCYFYGGGWGRDQMAEYESIPLGTEAALEIIDRHQPDGCTPVAQIMKKYLLSPSEGIKKLKSLVIVTDEGENESWQNMRLVDAMRKYRGQVGYNIEVMVIAIQSEDTTITESLNAYNFNVVRYRCDKLENIESLFAMIQANTAAFMVDQHEASRILKLNRNLVTSKTLYVELDKDMYKYKKQRDNIFASVIKGACVNCGAPISVEEVTRFRFGNSIICENCEFTMSPTLFGDSHV